jgi:hypothetical protein
VILLLIHISYHYAASVKIATPENGGAVDGSGRVYGTQLLHVADNSIQPLTSLSAYLIGSKIAQDSLNIYQHEKRIKFKFCSKC